MTSFIWIAAKEIGVEQGQLKSDTTIKERFSSHEKFSKAAIYPQTEIPIAVNSNYATTTISLAPKSAEI